MALTVSFDLISDVLVVPRRRPRGISRVISRRASRTGVTRSREERRPFLILEVVFLSSCSYFLSLFLSFLLSMLLFSTFFLLSYSPARAEKKFPIRINSAFLWSLLSSVSLPGISFLLFSLSLCLVSRRRFLKKKQLEIAERCLLDTWKLDRDGAAVKRSDKREFR